MSTERKLGNERMRSLPKGRTPNMTDDKVKEAAERIRALADCYERIGEDDRAQDLRTVLSAYDALQAERDKLAAEVERLRVAILGGEDAPGLAMSLTEGDVLRALADNHRLSRDRAEAAEAKLTALVEASERLVAAVECTCGYITNRPLMRAADEVRQAIAHHSAPVEPVPIPMLLFCPKCGVQHVDAPEPPKMRPVHNGFTGEWIGQSNVAWTNPPHRSHLCHACGCIWRPADVPTEGVATITTKGSGDNWAAPPTTPTSAPVEDVAAIIKRCHDQRGDVPDDWIRSAAELIAGQPCKASVLREPVEDVGGLVEKIARALCDVNGQDADEYAPLGMICGGANEPCLWWTFYEEHALAILAALSPSLIQPQGEERS